MPKTIGIDVGKGAIKIAVIKNDKVQKTQIIDVVENDSQHVLQQLKRFFKSNKRKNAVVNVLIKDYRTKWVKVQKLSGRNLKNALFYEREEKIGTSEILGENYIDNHIIQKKTGGYLDVLLTVVNEDEVESVSSLLKEIGFKEINYYMECYLYNEIVPENSVIIDFGYRSIQLMFFDKKKVVKTSLMKKGIADIISDLKDKVGDHIKLYDFMKFNMADKDDLKYEIIISKLGMYADNIINGINSFARENSKDAGSINIFYTGGIFSIEGMSEYFNYLMGVKGKILAVFGGKEEPLFNNSIALARKQGDTGRVKIGYEDYLHSINRIASVAVMMVITFVTLCGAYRAYDYFSITEQKKAIDKAYTERKEVYEPMAADYNRLVGLLERENRLDNKNAKRLSDSLSYILANLSENLRMKEIKMESQNVLIIEGTADNYTNFGNFCIRLKKKFSECNVETLNTVNGTTVVFRLECKL